MNKSTVRRFRRLVMDDVFWRSVDLGLRLVPPGTVGQLLDRGVVTLRYSAGLAQALNEFMGVALLSNPKYLFRDSSEFSLR